MYRGGGVINVQMTDQMSGPNRNFTLKYTSETYNVIVVTYRYSQKSQIPFSIYQNIMCENIQIYTCV
jgi:spore coat protein CotH